MFKIAASVLVSLVLVTTVYARAPFVLDATVDKVNRSLGFHDILDMIDTLNEAPLARIFPHYTDPSPGEVNVDFRGLPVRLQYGQRATTLHLTLSFCRIHKSFVGTTRDAGAKQLETYLEREGSHDLTCILQSLAKTSPIDPLTGIAGNVYQTMTMSNDALGSNHSSTGTEAETPNQFGFGMRFRQYSTRGFDSTVVTIPPSYTINTIHGLGFGFDLPMALAHTDGAHAYNASLGFGVRLPISRWLHFDRDEWDITPLARVGATGSLEMASVGLVYALHVDITDLVARYATIPLHVRDLRIDAMFLPRPITFWPFPSKKLSMKVHRHTFNCGRAFCPASKGFSFNLRYTF